MKELKSPFQAMSFKNAGFILLFIGVVISCMSIVWVRHQGRSLHIELQDLKKKQFALNIEWSQLILEKSTWRTKTRVDFVARKQLGMFMPSRRQVRILRP